MDYFCCCSECSVAVVCEGAFADEEGRTSHSHFNWMKVWNIKKAQICNACFELVLIGIFFCGVYRLSHEEQII